MNVCRWEDHGDEVVITFFFAHIVIVQEECPQLVFLHSKSHDFHSFLLHIRIWRLVRSSAKNMNKGADFVEMKKFIRGLMSFYE